MILRSRALFFSNGTNFSKGSHVPIFDVAILEHILIHFHNMQKDAGNIMPLFVNSMIIPKVPDYFWGLRIIIFMWFVYFTVTASTHTFKTCGHFTPGHIVHALLY